MMGDANIVIVLIIHHYFHHQFPVLHKIVSLVSKFSKLHSKNSFTCNYLLAVIIILQVSK